MVTRRVAVVHARSRPQLDCASAIRSSRIRSWRTLHARGLILRVWFLDAQHGYAVGLQKSVFETHDGGRTWKPLAEAAVPESNPAYSVYSHIAFADVRRGMIAGGYAPPRIAGKSRVERDEEDDLPDSIHPETLFTGVSSRGSRSNWTRAIAVRRGSRARLRCWARWLAASGRGERPAGFRLRWIPSNGRRKFTGSI